MINKHSIALGENIAVGIPTGVLVQGSEIIQALNGESYGALPYTEQFREQIIEVTRDTTSHTEMMGVASSALAETVRGAFEMLKTYGVPLATAIGSGLGVIYSAGALRSLATSRVAINFSNIDDPFFDSAIYPTEGQVVNKALSFSNVSLDVLKRLEFDWASETSVREFIASTHPEIGQILDSKEAALDYATHVLGSLEALGGVFERDNETVFDFTRIKSVRINLLLKMYVVLTKMRASSTPAPWLLKGSLEDYRSYVELLWNALTTYLVQLKKVVQNYKARKIVLVPMGRVGMVEFTPPEVKGTVLKVLSGEITVYYTNEVMAMAERAGNSLMECVIAATYANSNPPGAPSILSLVEDKALTTEITSRYYSGLHNTMDAKARTVFIESTLESMVKFINERPAAKQALYARAGDDGASVYTLIHGALIDDIDKLYHLYAATCKEDRYAVDSDDHERASQLADVVLKTDLVPKFLRLLGCDMAAEIIELTFVRQEVEDNLSGKRERLHGALITLLAKKLLA